MTELRYFSSGPLDSRQQENNVSFALEPEYFYQSDNTQSLTFKLFARYDQHDNERSHADIRELMWIKAADQWELRAGIGKVFWGVAESQHLVDIINQSDAVENMDLEEKLGQPMIDLSLIGQYGTFDIFVLPYFRERTFAGSKGRPRAIPYVDTDHVFYQSDKQNRHIDYAARWYKSINEWDLGLSYFNGTSRDPRLVAANNNSGETVLQPHYDLITQTGLDIQGTFDAWLWKLEVIHRSGVTPAYTAMTGGFEYSFYDIRHTGADLGVLLEYMYDNRALNSPGPFQNDILLGLRYTLNDTQSTEFLLGQIIDRHTHASSFNLEASRRMASNIKLNLEAHYFTRPDTSDPAYVYRDDDYIQAELVYYF
ncbi:MAG: hypothetical protein OEY89_11360 [Gammaproteobacteria bacterium]|nr:hypothetical protein [Gammaproteobacteria bacterium]